jgi:scyllo-inositol 2-dehydrogenase (NADP+)
VPVRYLVAGLGNIGRKRRAVLGARCVATADPFSPEADYSVAEACPADLFDAVVLSVPNQPKLQLLEHFLGLGKHVLVEKPLLLRSCESAERLDQLARQRGVIWYTSYNHRFEPLILALKKHIDDQTIGLIYHGRLSYGNGTAGNVAGTWRDEGLGVLEDLGSHLLDLAGYMLGCRGAEFVGWSLQRHESGSFDHGILASEDGRFALEMSFLCWKNTFAVDLFGERGSLHLYGLRKWGPSELVVRERVFPSGVPRETRRTSHGPDETWHRDVEHFEALAATGCTSMRNDWWISRTLQRVAAA